MKPSLFFLLLSLLFAKALEAQQGKNADKWEQMQSAQLQFLAQELQLTETEKQGFEPLYRRFKEEERTLRGKRKRGEHQQQTSWQNMSDAELENYLESQIAREQAWVDLRRRYLNEYKKVLPLRKIAALPQAERSFKRALLDRAQEKQAAER